MKLAISRVLSTAAFASVALVGLSPAPASASAACDKFNVCGDVYHTKTSQRSHLIVTCDWVLKRPNRSVPRGQWGSCSDVDGFYVPSGYRAWVSAPGSVTTNKGPGWHKVTDIQNVRVTLYRS